MGERGTGDFVKMVDLEGRNGEEFKCELLSPNELSFSEISRSIG